MIDFNIKNNKLIIDAQTLTVSAFNDIWESDSSKNKSHACNLLVYVFHVSDITEKNPFRDLPDSQRDAYAKRNAFGDQNYKFKKGEEELIARAKAWYEALNNNSILRLSIAMDMKLDQIATFLLDSKNDIKEMHQLEAQADLMAKVEKVLISKKRTDEFVRQQLEKTKIKGGQKLSPLEMGILNTSYE
jgi:hypothetical protein